MTPKQKRIIERQEAKQQPDPCPVEIMIVDGDFDSMDVDRIAEWRWPNGRSEDA